MAENTNFVGGEDLLRSRGVDVVNLQDGEITRKIGSRVRGERHIGTRILARWTGLSVA
jgi:hypothetical protein